MAKTKPIGVRFDEDFLQRMVEDGFDTPQKVLNFLTDQAKSTDYGKVKKIIPNEKAKELKNKLTPLSEPIKIKSVLQVMPEINDDPKNNKVNIDRLEAEAKIKEIQAEKIPDHRNTSIGRKSWQIEQDNRIKELKK